MHNIQMENAFSWEIVDVIRWLSSNNFDTEICASFQRKYNTWIMFLLLIK